MEWSGFLEMETQFMGNSFEMMEENKEGWNLEDNKLFEDVLAECDPFSPTLYRDLASRIPWKSVGEIEKHYQDLVEDIGMIEAGLIPLPNYVNSAVAADDQEDVSSDLEVKKEPGSLSSSSSSSRSKKIAGATTTSSSHQRRRGVPWTEQEHQLFLMGLNKYGKGDWRSISRYYVVTKTPTQVASHAQKYYRRQNSTTPVDRRRPSIHDIQTVNLSSPPARQTKNNFSLIPTLSNNTITIPGLSPPVSSIQAPAANSFPVINNLQQQQQQQPPNNNANLNSAYQPFPSLMNPRFYWG